MSVYDFLGFCFVLLWVFCKWRKKTVPYELGTLIANITFACITTKPVVGKWESMGILRPLKWHPGV